MEMGPLLRWLGLFAPSVKAAATTLQLLARRMPRHASRSQGGRAAPWSELPPELLGLVFSRLPSQADRVRVRAVCRPWRSAARLQPLPAPLPYLLLRDNTALALPDAALHRLPVDWRGIDLRVSAGAVLFLRDSFCRCYLLDPFSRSRDTAAPQRINLSDRHQYPPPGCGHSGIRKVVVSHHLVAVLLRGKVHFFPRGEGPYSTMVWATPGNTHFAVDMALFQGKLCVLTDKFPYDGSQLPELHLLDIRFLDISHRQTHIRSVKCIQGMPRNPMDPALPLPLPANQRRCFFFYLVVSGDRLLMVELPSVQGSTQFEVWEWVDQIASRGRWSKVHTLMGRTLFVSADCSRSLPAHSGAPQDHIYYVPERMSDPPQDDCIVYNVKDRKTEQLPSNVRATMTVRNPDRRWHPTWLFPADD